MGLQHLKAGRAARILDHPGRRGEIADESVGEGGREVSRFPPGEVDQNVGHVVGLLLKVEAGDQVGRVFLGGKRGGLAVRCSVGQRVDGGAAHRSFVLGIGMDGKEKIGGVITRKLHT